MSKRNIDLRNVDLLIKPVRHYPDIGVWFDQKINKVGMKRCRYQYAKWTNIAVANGTIAPSSIKTLVLITNFLVKRNFSEALRAFSIRLVVSVHVCLVKLDPSEIIDENWLLGK